MTVPEAIVDMAFKLARDALMCEEVPVACIVYNEAHEILASGRNEVNESLNACRHAEMVAIDSIVALADQLKIPIRQFTKSCAVYVTVEPCVMCAVALREIGLTNVQFGCRNFRFGGCGSIVRAHAVPLACGCIAGCGNDQRDAPQLDIKEGIRSSQAIKLLKSFYEGENPKVCKEKLKS